MTIDRVNTKTGCTLSIYKDKERGQKPTASENQVQH